MLLVTLMRSLVQKGLNILSGERAEANCVYFGFRPQLKL